MGGTPLFTISLIRTCHVHCKYTLNAGFMTLARCRSQSKAVPIRILLLGSPWALLLRVGIQSTRARTLGKWNLSRHTFTSKHLPKKNLTLKSLTPSHSLPRCLQAAKETSEKTRHDDIKPSATQQLPKCKPRRRLEAYPETKPHLPNPCNHWGNQVCPSLIYILLYVIEN